MNIKKLNREDAVVVAIDFQEKLLPAMNDPKKLEATVIKLIKGARVLEVPIIVTQQYTKGLGPTTEPVTHALTDELFEGVVPAADFTPVEKNTFSAMDEPEFVKAIKAAGRKNVILCGIEAHICTQQTMLDLAEAGYNVFVVCDCIDSRDSNNKTYSEARMAGAGAILTTYEAVLYEMLKGSKGAGFKQISAIVK